MLKGYIMTTVQLEGSDIQKFLDMAIGPVSYTHLTLPTICSV